MNKQCKNCNKTFKIDDQDLEFYKKMQVPQPTHCPDCRQQRRLAWRNERKLYARTCDLCKKSIISIYSPESLYLVYCQECWWSDRWDALQYGRQFDFNRPFFEQFHDLQLQVPRLALFNLHSINSEYTNHSFDNKNCYMGVAFGGCEDCYYGQWLLNSRNCLDCLYLTDCELCYECSYCNNCYQTYWSQHCDNMQNSLLCFECRDCANCLGCVQLQHQQYAILNKTVSVNEFNQQKQVILNDPKKFQELQKAYEVLKLKTPRRWSLQVNCENCTGNDLYYSTNANACFHCRKVQNCKYVYDAVNNIDCFDSYEHGWDIASQLIYETHAGMAGYNLKFCHICAESRDLEYCDCCFSNSVHLFGCVGLKNQKFVILNKQYSETDYFKMKNEIIKHMSGGKQTREYGEFFPIKYSPFAYNESVAQEYFRLNKTEVLRKRWYWRDEVVQQKQTIGNFLTCQSCQQFYRLIPQEIKFYQQISVKAPKYCPDCRHLQRMRLRNSRQLWHRQCMCTQPDHNHNGRCATEFETTYSPDRKELIYCEQCYNKEIY